MLRALRAQLKGIRLMMVLKMITAAMYKGINVKSMGETS
jgi:hypothetical protein